MDTAIENMLATNAVANLVESGKSTSVLSVDGMYLTITPSAGDAFSGIKQIGTESFMVFIKRSRGPYDHDTLELVNIRHVVQVTVDKFNEAAPAKAASCAGETAILQPFGGKDRAAVEHDLSIFKSLFERGQHVIDCTYCGEPRATFWTVQEDGLWAFKCAACQHVTSCPPGVAP